MSIRDLVDTAVDEDPRAVPLGAERILGPVLRRSAPHTPNLIGAVIYRDKTIRDGGR